MWIHVYLYIPLQKLLPEGFNQIKHWVIFETVGDLLMISIQITYNIYNNIMTELNIWMQALSTESNVFGDNETITYFSPAVSYSDG